LHQWLFDRRGSFRDADLLAGLRSLGFDAREFIEVMSSEETLAIVRSDIEDAMWLGLHYTPMIFINGLELKGIFTPNALTRTVTEVLAQNPPAQTSEIDQPPPAVAKCVDDWREQPVLRHQPDTVAWTLGPADAKLRIVVWGDYQEPNTAVVDSLVRAFVSSNGEASYTFRHYPVNQECNPKCAVNRHPLACLAAQGAEAAGHLGGDAAYWEMHAWLMENRETLSARGLSEQAAALGFDVDAFNEAMSGEAAARVITEDCDAARRLGATSIPLIHVNERAVPRWRFRGKIVLDRILEAALED
jgi:predicted DsbA family dithiol-disulfide isomerase